MVVGQTALEWIAIDLLVVHLGAFETLDDPDNSLEGLDDLDIQIGQGDLLGAPGTSHVGAPGGHEAVVEARYIHPACIGMRVVMDTVDTRHPFAGGAYGFDVLVCGHHNPPHCQERHTMLNLHHHKCFQTMNSYFCIYLRQLFPTDIVGEHPARHG